MRIVELEYPTGNETIVIIENADGSETSMLKSYYDEQQAQAEHFTPIVTSDE
jgi:hypothetical protein